MMLSGWLRGGSGVLHEGIRRFVIVLLGCWLIVPSGCGWQLQGTARLPERMAITYVDTEDRYTDFSRALRDALRASGARLTEERRDATAVIRILNDDSDQRVLSVSARNTPEEYEVYYAIEYSVVAQGAEGSEELIEAQKLELTRDYSYSTATMLANQREQSILREALARDLAALVVRRLAAL
ncbi:LPS-assembly lipoprotein LptE [Steroidobacter denitrificans]|nr:LPS assembly lipoprotein LptE [Steroidobacter denitrificans]